LVTLTIVFNRPVEKFVEKRPCASGKTPMLSHFYLFAPNVEHSFSALWQELAGPVASDK
jgi:hypothetical protein